MNKAQHTKLFLSATLAAIFVLLTAPMIQADTIRMRDGVQHEGIIQEISSGQVRVEINPESPDARQVLTFDIRDIESMQFDTPHLLATGDQAVDHFLSSVEAQEVVERFAELDRTKEELERLMEQVRGYWQAKQPIERSEVQAWEAARDTFRRPLSRYQEVLNDLYFHVLARVDEYNQISRDAKDIYVGVEGIFNVGSPLLPTGMEELSLRKYVPASWYDTIFYQGYNVGYNEAYDEYSSDND